MSNPLLDKLKQSARLPSPPGIALQVLNLCQSNEVSIGDLADTLAADPALSLRLLKYANSALVGASKEITSVRDAVVLLGLRSVRLMALSFSLVSKDDDNTCKQFNYDRFWAHSVACAVSARLLAKIRPPLATEEAFACGLLAHIGKLAFALGMPEPYETILQNAGGTLGRTEKAEAACLGCSHVELGADLLADWGIPDRMVRVVRHQARPRDIDDDEMAQALTEILGSATDMADILCQAGPDAMLSSRFETMVRAPLFADREQAEQVLDVARDEYHELAKILAVEGGTTRTPDEIQAEAGAVLTELSLATQLQSDAVEKKNRDLEEKAWTDALTGIGNRAAFDQRLQEAWDESADRGAPIALILMDIDHFKKFNDTYGHQTGDAVLQTVGGCLPGAVRDVDFVARYGGEEFAIILPNADRMTAAHISVKVRKAIESAVVDFEGQQHRVTVSVGTALLPKTAPPFTPKILIETADKQLYASKGKGRNCCSMKQLQPKTAAAATSCSS